MMRSQLCLGLGLGFQFVLYLGIIESAVRGWRLERNSNFTLVLTTFHEPEPNLLAHLKHCCIGHTRKTKEITTQKRMRSEEQASLEAKKKAKSEPITLQSVEALTSTEALEYLREMKATHASNSEYEFIRIPHNASKRKAMITRIITHVPGRKTWHREEANNAGAFGGETDSAGCAQCTVEQIGVDNCGNDASSSNTSDEISELRRVGQCVCGIMVEVDEAGDVNWLARQEAFSAWIGKMVLGPEQVESEEETGVFHDTQPGVVRKVALKHKRPEPAVCYVEFESTGTHKIMTIEQVEAGIKKQSLHARANRRRQ